MLRIIGMVISFLISILLARFLGAEGMGVYGSVMAIVALAIVFSQFGFPFLLTREIARQDARDNLAGMKQISWFLVFVVGCIALLIVIPLGAGLFKFSPFKVVNDPYLYLMGMIIVFCWALNNALFGILKGMKKVPLAQSLEGVLRPALQLAGLVIFVVILKKFDVSNAFIALVVASILTLIISFFVTSYALPKSRVDFRPKKPIIDWFRSAATFTSVDILRVFEYQYAILIAGFFVPLAAIGELRLTLSLIVFATLPATVISLVIMPYIVNLEQKVEITKLQNLIFISTLACVVMALLIVLGEYLLGPILIHAFFGAEFSGSHWPLFWFCMAYLIQSLGGGIGTIVLNMTGHEKVVGLIFLGATLIGLVVFLVCLPNFGILAAPFGIIGSEIVKTIIVSVYVHKKLNIRSDIFWGLSNWREVRLSIKG